MVKDNVRINDISSKVLKDAVISDLEKEGINTELESFTDELVQIKASKGLNKTTIQLERNRHRPLFVEVNIDYLIIQELNKSLDKMAKAQGRRGLTQGFGGGGIFRYYILFIILGAIASVLYTFGAWISESIERTALTISVIVFALLLVALNPVIQSRFNRSLQNFDKKLLDIVSKTLTKLRAEETNLTEKSVLKCWNCFEDVPIGSSFCEACGEQQDKV